MMRPAAAILVFVMLAAPSPAAGGGGRSGGSSTAQLPQDPGGSRGAGGVQGVVLAQAGGILTLLARGNVLLTVVVAGTAAVSGGRTGRPVRDELSLARGSIVEVAGPRNSDGSLSAQRLAVLFDARGASRLSGRIVRGSQDGGLVLSDGTVATLSEDLWVFRGTTLLSAGVLTPGVAVTLYGTARGGRFLARVIEVSL